MLSAEAPCLRGRSGSEAQAVAGGHRRCSPGPGGQARSSMAGIVEGTFLAIKYAVAGPPIYHERLVLSSTRFENWFIILTPDFDCFVEER